VLILHQPGRPEAADGQGSQIEGTQILAHLLELVLAKARVAGEEEAMAGTNHGPTRPKRLKNKF
jgi:hypothetical protein